MQGTQFETDENARNAIDETYEAPPLIRGDAGDFAGLFRPALLRPRRK
ncbi:hypothetical protein SDC9_160697 [bioreactor metagenome]|uniref:Uncharacterized protein n=1 Tax=bioreactor metagenome TaxID=1076179 RepID=A0A645FIB8_9ZZZZ